MKSQTQQSLFPSNQISTDNTLDHNILQCKRMHDFMFYKMFFIQNKCANFARFQNKG